ncbi:hypothetical protein EG68_10534 [Paragonimus skrjabini miyazakii]|uniref:Secreted protein n=1 Tax=Paragonimus skrjabini miyazakii TaxID=59628 RepID=A0A8S9YI84_9TREM|nr:hypothetical protein EG68_10534 [Paragonimus skrjabini miyazakii]
MVSLYIIFASQVLIFFSILQVACSTQWGRKHRYVCRCSSRESLPPIFFSWSFGGLSSSLQQQHPGDAQTISVIATHFPWSTCNIPRCPVLHNSDPRFGRGDRVIYQTKGVAD